MCHCIQVYLFLGRCFSCMFSHLWPGDCVHSPSGDELDYARAVSKPKDSTCNEANLQTTLITGLCLWCDHCLTGFCFDRKLLKVQQVGTCSQAWNPGWGAMIWPVEPLNYILLLTNATTFFFLSSVPQGMLLSATRVHCLKAAKVFSFTTTYRVALVHCSGIFSLSLFFFFPSFFFVLVKALHAMIGL